MEGFSALYMTGIIIIISVFNMSVSPLSFSLSICLPMQCTGAVTAVPGVGLYYYQYHYHYYHYYYSTNMTNTTIIYCHYCHLHYYCTCVLVLALFYAHTLSTVMILAEHRDSQPA